MYETLHSRKSLNATHAHDSTPIGNQKPVIEAESTVGTETHLHLNCDNFE